MSSPGAGGAGTLPTSAAVGVVVALGLLLAACGGPAAPREVATPGPSATAPQVPTAVVVSTPTTAAPAPAGTSVLPDLTVDNVAGGTVNLSSLAPAPRPVLLWFWAPT